MYSRMLYHNIKKIIKMTSLMQKLCCHIVLLIVNKVTYTTLDGIVKRLALFDRSAGQYAYGIAFYC